MTTIHRVVLSYDIRDATCEVKVEKIEVRETPAMYIWEPSSYNLRRLTRAMVEEAVIESMISEAGWYKGCGTWRAYCLPNDTEKVVAQMKQKALLLVTTGLQYAQKAYDLVLEKLDPCGLVVYES
jgi:hypothetical protein